MFDMIFWSCLAIFFIVSAVGGLIETKKKGAKKWESALEAIVICASVNLTKETFSEEREQAEFLMIFFIKTEKLVLDEKAGTKVGYPTVSALCISDTCFLGGMFFFENDISVERMQNPQLIVDW